MTLPNATSVPEIVEGIVTVYLRDNGTFGKHDPIQWPQLYVARYPYLAAIPKNTGAPCSESATWNHLSQDIPPDYPVTPPFAGLNVLVDGSSSR